MVTRFNHFLRRAIPAASAVLLFASCMQDGPTGPEKVTLKQPPVAAESNPRLEFLSKSIDLTKNDVELYVDSLTRDTSYVITPRISAQKLAMKEKSAPLRKLEAHQGSYGLRLSVIDTLIEREKKQKLNSGTDIAPLNSSKNRLAKGAHTRWVHWTSLLDVKALTEVRQIKVYILQTNGASINIGINWRTGIRNAIANWNTQAKGSAISFVEVNDPNISDVVVRGALLNDGRTYVAWINPSPYVERIPSFGGDPTTSVDIVLNIGYENNGGVPISEKTKIAMTAFATILNIGWIDTENWYWNNGDFTYVPGTVRFDGDEFTPGSSILTQNSTPVSTPVMTPGDLHLFRTLYPVHAITAKLSNNTLSIAGYEGFTTVATNVKAFQTDGDTLVYSTNDGKLFRRIGLDGTNVQMWPASGSSGNVNTFQHSKGYLMVTTASPDRVYTRTPTGNWVIQFSSAGAVLRPKLDGEKLMAVISIPPQIVLQYLSSGPGVWHLEWYGSNVLDYQIHNGALVLSDEGSVWVKPTATGAWTQVHSAANGVAQKLYVSNDLIAFYRVPTGSSVGYPSVLVGGVGGYMHYLTDPMYSPEDMDVCGDKFAFTQQGAHLRVIDYGQWVVHEHYNIPGHYDNTAKLRLGGGTCEHVTIVDNNQNLWAKYGASLGTDYQLYQSGVAALTQRP